MRLALLAALAALAGPAFAEPPAPAAPPAPPPASLPALSGAAAAPSAGGTPAAMPYNIPYGAPVGLAVARRMVDAAVAEATRRGWPTNVAVVDDGGDLVAFARMDGAQRASVAISQRKARTSARFRRETRVFFNAMETGHPNVATLDPELVASPGGFPLIVDGKLIGAIGCSGGTGDQDAVICKAALDAAK